MSVENDELRARDERLRWHCRRALLELDIVFSRFWKDQDGRALTEEEARELASLLALEDHPLWHLISQEAAPEQESGVLLQKLRRL